MSGMIWSKSSSSLTLRKGSEWKDVVPKSSTLQDLMTKVYDGVYANGELSVNVVMKAEVQKVQQSWWIGQHPYCLIQLKNPAGTASEGRQYKTAIIKDINPCWNEAFIMELKNKISVVLWIEVRSYSMIGKDKPIGKCVVPLDLLVEDILLTKQFPLISENEKEEIGYITLQMIYTSAIRRNMDYLTAVEHFDLVSKMLFDDEATLVEGLCQVCKDDDLSLVLIRIFNAHGMAHNLLSTLMSSEIQARGEPTTLFRTDSMATKTMRNYFHLISRRSYLNRQIIPVVNEISSVIKRGGSFEIYSNMLNQGEDIDENVQNLWKVTRDLIERVLNSFDAIPGNIKKFFGVLGKLLEEKYGSILLGPVGSLFFLRFFCPGVVFPVESGVVQAESINPAISRGLLLVGKLLQGVVGRVEFREEALKPFNSLTVHFSNDVDQFLKKLCHPTNAANIAKEPSSFLGPVDDPRSPYTKDELTKLMSIILRKINVNFDQIKKYRTKDEVKNSKIREVCYVISAIFAEIT